jgi:hypothetical protein
MIKRLKAVGLAIVAALVVACVAYTATNSMSSPPSIGIGTSSVNGFIVSNIQFAPNASDPTKLDAVSFDYNPTTATVGKVQLNPGGSWYSCSLTAGHATCDTTSPQQTTMTMNQFAAFLNG